MNRILGIGTSKFLYLKPETKKGMGMSKGGKL